MAGNHDSTTTASRGPRVAYVMTDYPRLAMTFITGEIDEVERTGGDIVPIAMNSPEAEDLESTDGRRRSASTLYLKQHRIALLRAVLGLALSHPLHVAKLAAFAIRSARLDLSIVVRRLAHLAYAALAVERCRTEDVRHLHAHFGQSPATIAWFTALIGNWEEPGRWTWSFTIHGFQDFVDDKDARLDLKAESASFVVCISDFTRSQLCRVSDPSCWNRFHVIKCGLDLDLWPFRTVTGPSSDRPTIVTVARLSAEKGHGVLIEACRILRDDRGIEVDVDLIGDGPFRSELEDLAEATGLGSAVTFHGQLPQQDIVDHLRTADMFCLASFSEGLPVSIMEAMALGVPVVSTHISGIPELAINGRSAMTMPPGNPPALADAIADMLADSTDRNGLATTARHLVERHHDRVKNVATLVDLFTNVIATTEEGTS